MVRRVTLAIGSALHRATTLPTCVATARIMIATKPAAARVSIGAIPVNVDTTRPTCAYRKLPRRKCRRDRLGNKRSSKRPVHARTDGVFGNHSSSPAARTFLHPLQASFEHGHTALHRRPRPLAARSSAPTFPRSLYLGRHAGSILSEVGWSLLRSDREYEVQSGEFQQLAYATRGVRQLQFKAGRVS